MDCKITAYQKTEDFRREFSVLLIGIFRLWIAFDAKQVQEAFVLRIQL